MAGDHKGRPYECFCQLAQPKLAKINTEPADNVHQFTLCCQNTKFTTRPAGISTLFITANWLASLAARQHSTANSLNLSHQT